jgi:hypothetical protein
LNRYPEALFSFMLSLLSEAKHLDPSRRSG